MSGATPGPWIAVANRGNNAVSDVVDRDGYTIAHCRNVSVGCWDANARLIAAAPDLLAALKLFRTKVYNAALCSGMDHEWATEACSLADAAIAKAEGGAE